MTTKPIRSEQCGAAVCWCCGQVPILREELETVKAQRDKWLDAFNRSEQFQTSRREAMEHGMSDAETAKTIREWCAKPRPLWGWPTDECGYDQHIKFVRHRNEHFKLGDDFKTFVLAYADTIDPPRSQKAEGK